MMPASLATPEKAADLPAAMPATCVPCSQPATLQFTPDPDAVDCATPPGQTEAVPLLELVVE